jgi:hypothetical protein
MVLYEFAQMSMSMTLPAVMRGLDPRIQATTLSDAS